jgi:uncharacterized protein YacL
MATDMEIGIRIQVDGIEVEASGSAVLPVTRFGSILRESTDEKLRVEADAQGVKVLNINELVEAVKLSVLPGETLEVEIQHEGKSKNQGVGYMPDGTMTVVKGGHELIGKTVEAKVLKVIQSKAGKIIFTDLIYKDNK